MPAKTGGAIDRRVLNRDDLARHRGKEGHGEINLGTGRPSTVAHRFQTESPTMGSTSSMDGTDRLRRS